MLDLKIHFFNAVSTTNEIPSTSIVLRHKKVFPQNLVNYIKNYVHCGIPVEISEKMCFCIGFGELNLYSLHYIYILTFQIW